MARRLSGINPLSYLGVEPSTPPDLVIDTRAPTPTDSQYNIGTLWVFPAFNQIWMLTQFTYRSVATWTIIDTGTAGATIFPTDNGIANELNGVLNIVGTVSTGGVTRTTGIVNSVIIELTTGNNGQLIIGGGVQPIWADLTSSDGSITITAGANTLDIVATNTGAANSFPTNSGIAVPNAGSLSIFGGSNINTAVGAPDVVFVNLNTSILLPTTTADEANGVIAIGNALVNSFLHGFGTENTFTGPGAGNFTLTELTAVNNTGIGSVALDSLTVGTDNTAVGRRALRLVTTGSDNVAVGSGALSAVLTGSNNIGIGLNAGNTYVAAEASNIAIGNVGVVGDANVLRIGSLTAGTGAGQQNRCHIQSVYGVTVSAGTTSLVTIDSTGLMGSSAPITGTGFVRSTAGAMSVYPDSVADGQLLISSSAGVPIWANLTSTGATVTITTGHNSINLEAGGGGGGGTVSFITNTGGPASPTVGGAISILGVANQLTTDGSVAHTVNVGFVTNPQVTGTLTCGTGLTVTTGNTTLTPLAGARPGTVRSSTTGVLSTIIDPAVNGELLISSAAGVPIWAPLTSTGGSVTITTGANSINLEAAGVAALTQLSTDVGGPVAPLAGNINLINGTNISTDGSTAHAVHINLIASPVLAGSLTVGTGLTVTTGGITAAGPITLSSLTGGVVQASNAGLLTSSRGTNGQILIGTGAGTNPVWANLTSAGGTVTITNGSGTINLEAGGGGGGGASVFTTSAGTATAIGPTIQFLSGENTNTDGGTNIVHVNLNRSIVQPPTNADGSEGMYSLGNSIQNNPFMHNYGTHNTFLGIRAGARAGAPTVGTPFTLTGTDSTGIGFHTLQDLTSAINNTAVGSNALTSATTGGSNVAIGRRALTTLTTGSTNVAIGTDAGDAITIATDNVLIGQGAGGSLQGGSRNTCIGSTSAQNLTTGTSNILIGYFAGSALAGNEFSNVYIASQGVLGESQSIRIGTQTTQLSTRIAGIYGTARTVPDRLVFADSTGKLATGTLAFGAGTLVSSGTGVISSLPNGTDGQVLIADTGGTPAWRNITAGTGITIINAANSITISTGAPVSFLMRVTNNLSNVTGDGLGYNLGTQATGNGILTIVSDTAGACYPGNNLGSPATFTAPITGNYLITATVAGNNFILPPPPPPPQPICPVVIVTPAANYTFDKGLVTLASGNPGSVQAETATIVVPLTAGDVVRWIFYINGLPRTIGIQAVSTSVGGGNLSYVSGALIK